MAQTVKNPPAMQIWVRSRGWESPIEKGMATHSSILAWRIHNVVLVSDAQQSDLVIHIYILFFKFFSHIGYYRILSRVLVLCSWSLLIIYFTCSSMYIGEGNGTPLQYSCLENPMDGGAWWAAVHGVAKSQTRLSDFTFTFHFHALEKEMATHSSVLAWRIPRKGEPGGLPSMGSH